MRRIPADTSIAILLLLACGFLGNDLLNTEGSGAYVKTTTMPMALVIVLALLSGFLLIGSLLEPNNSPGTKLESTPVLVSTSLGRVAAMLGWTIGFVFVLPWLGYLLATAIFLAGANLLYGNRNLVSILAVAIIVPISLYLFFEKFMIILLPTSRLFG